MFSFDSIGARKNDNSSFTFILTFGIWFFSSFYAFSSDKLPIQILTENTSHDQQFPAQQREIGDDFGGIIIAFDDREAGILDRPVPPTAGRPDQTGMEDDVVHKPNGKRSLIHQTVTDSHGNTYALGMFLGDVMVGNQILTSRGESDLFLAKFTRENQLEWVLQLGGHGAESPFSLQLDAWGAPFLAGHFSQSVAMSDQSFQSKGRQDLFLASFTSTGTIAWAQQMGGTGYDYLISIELDESGQIWVQGAFSHTESFALEAPETVTSRGFLAEYNQDGSIQSLAMND